MSERKPVTIPPWWEAAAAEVSLASPAPVVVICGPKNSGKSTFARFLLNSLLQRYEKVGYLDTDVGQPEFSLPGCLSLHMIDREIEDLGVGELRPSVKCFFYGDLSAKRDPEAYEKCVFNLYDYFFECYISNHFEKFRCSPLPLIVNTPGWVKGAGFDILVAILRYIRPSIVVQTRISAEKKNLPVGKFWLESDETGCSSQTIDISSALHDSLNRSILFHKDALGMRDHRIREYFKQCFPSNISTSTNKDLAYALACIPPYQVSLLRIRVSHLHFQVPDGDKWYSLNGSIVGLVASSERVKNKGSALCCIGHGIVRGIDTSRDLLYLITPVCIEDLQNVDLLQQGLVPIPSSLLQVRGWVSPYMSTHVIHRIAEQDQDQDHEDA